MKKSKYEKPAMRNLDAVQPVKGSCWSGISEHTMGPPCTNGNYALQTCGTGSTALPLTGCSTGDEAGYSCTRGNEAG